MLKKIHRTTTKNRNTSILDHQSWKNKKNYVSMIFNLNLFLYKLSTSEVTIILQQISYVKNVTVMAIYTY